MTHPHAMGWKDWDRAQCRYCHKRFNVTRRKQAEREADEADLQS